MKLNWFSPLPPARTDIANYTTRLLPALVRKGIEIKVWATNENYAAAQLPESVAHAAGHTERLPWPEINFRDHTIYQVGNDHRFHGPILRHLEHHGGIVVLHETNLHEAQRMRFIDEEGSPSNYLARLGACGGDTAARDGRAHLDGRLSIDEMIERHPLTATVLTGAHGVIVHSPDAVDAVRKLTTAPIAHLPLPFSAEPDWPDVHRREWDGGRALRLVMFGFLHSPNRRLHAVLKAIACSRHRKQFRLDLFGELNAEFDLPRHLNELGLSEQVRFHGFVDETRMRTILKEADLAINLRNPTRGEASGSLLRIWSHSLPCVVSDAGIYALAPEDTVVRLPHTEDEILALASCLDDMVEDPEPYYQRGLNGRAHLARFHAPELYVEGLLEFLPLVEAYRGRAYLEHYLPRVSQEFIAELPAPAAQAYWLDRVADIFAGAIPETAPRELFEE